jgi:hypothetical protein
MIRNTLMPFVPDISREQSSIWHLQSLSCGSISMNSVELRSVLTTHYGGLIASGFDRARLEGHLPDGKKNYLDKFVESCAHDANKLQLSARSFEVLQAKVEADAIDLTTDQIRNVWNMFEATVPQDLGPLLEPHVPNVSALFELWKKTHLKHLDLSGLGIAIGHANAVRVFGLNVPLNIWIK